jgi:hypothetical protein
MGLIPLQFKKPHYFGLWVWPAGLRRSYSRAGVVENVKKKNTSKVFSHFQQPQPLNNFFSDLPAKPRGRSNGVNSPPVQHRMHASMYFGGFLNWRGINPITSASGFGRQV